MAIVFAIFLTLLAVWNQGRSLWAACISSWMTAALFLL